MREIQSAALKEALVRMILEANYVISDDITGALAEARRIETMPAAAFVLDQIMENNQIAKDERLAICQDTGMAVFFFEIGQDVHFTGGAFEDTVQQAVRDAYREGYLRKSIVAEPIWERKNTGDNTPAVIHTRIVPGDQVRVLFIAKGFGSENMSRIKMLSPASGEKGVLDCIVETALNAGPNACPPMIIGVGVGGDFESAAVLAKKMIARPVGSHHPDAKYAGLEAEALRRINASGIGPGGIGGRTLALAVNIGYLPTHIAGLPIAVNICCHASRHAVLTI